MLPPLSVPPVMYSSPQPPKLRHWLPSAVNVPPDIRIMPTAVGWPPKRHHDRIASAPPIKSTNP